MSQQPYGQQPGRPMPPTYGSGPQQPAYGSQPQPQQPAYGSQPKPQQPAYGSQPQPGYGSQPLQGYGSQPQPGYGAQSHPGYGGAPLGGPGGHGGPAIGAPVPEHAYQEGSAAYWQATESERSAAMWTHIGALFIGWLMPLIMFMMKKDESAFVREHARQSLNSQIMSAIIAYGIILISLPLMFIIIGMFTIFLAPIVPIIYAIFEIISAIRANKGEGYKHPMTPNMVK